MDFTPSPRAADLAARVREFVVTEVEPLEVAHRREVERRRAVGEDPWQPQPVVAELRREARRRGLWNLFLPAGHDGGYAARFGTDGGAGLTNLDYAPVAEAMGRSLLAPHVLNCNAPDTGNMELLLRHGDAQQRARWLEPLLDGRIRSAFAMTEPDVASSDPTNLAATVVLDGDEVVVDGRKWWTTGVGHPDCALLVVMGLRRPGGDPGSGRHDQHTMVLVPRDTPGVEVERMLPALGTYDEPFGHGQVRFTDVRVPRANLLVGEGRAARVAQDRLGPGRLHHAMRLVGLAERALELACRRGLARVAFGQRVVDLGGNRERVAEARIAIDALRLLVLHAAWTLDTVGPAGAAAAVAQVKVAAPRTAQQVIDFAIQVHGGAGVGDDLPLAAAWTSARTLRLADGPDEVHLATVARRELAKHADGHPAAPEAPR